MQLNLKQKANCKVNSIQMMKLTAFLKDNTKQNISRSQSQFKLNTF